MNDENKIYAKLKKECEELQISLYEEKNYFLTEKLHDLRGMSSNNNKKFISNLKNIISNALENKEGFKKIILLNNSLTIHFCYSAIIIHKNNITLIFDPSLLNVSILDSNFNLLYNFNYFNKNKFLYLNNISYLNENLGLLFNIKNKIRYFAYQSKINNNLIFNFKDSKVKQMIINKDNIEITYNRLEYSRIILNKKFEIKSIILSDSFYNKYSNFINSKEINLSNYSNFEHELEYLININLLNSDKKIKLTSVNEYQENIDQLKKIYNKSYLFDSDISPLTKLNSQLIFFNNLSFSNYDYSKKEHKYSDVLNCIKFNNFLTSCTFDLFEVDNEKISTLDKLFST